MVNIKNLMVFAGLIFISSAGLAQDRYMVFFKDKAGSSYSTDRPLEYLSQKAIDRRIKHAFVFTDHDFPVNPHYVDSVKNTGAEVFFTTRWMNGVLVQCDASLLPSIEALSVVDRVEFVAPQPRLISNARRKVKFRKKNNHTGVETEVQLAMLGIPDMHADALRGEGLTIAVFDGGFLGVNSIGPFRHVFSDGRFNDSASYDFVSNTTDVFQYDDHGTQVFSVIAADIPDFFTGGAPAANYQLYVTEDVTSEYRIEEYNWMFAAERADSAGADIINSSLGYYDFDDTSMNYTTAQMDGRTTVVTRAAQWAAERGLLVVCAAGNEGYVSSWRIITAPADAVDVIAVANVTQQGTVNGSSSVGPSADGRIKPDLAALGTGVRVIDASGSRKFSTGTSVAAPLITSLAAGVWQRYPELTCKEIIAVLKKMATHANNPDNSIGYGIPRYNALVTYLEEVYPSDVLEVFPNPFSDTIHIRPNRPETTISYVVEIISSQGKLLLKDTVNFNQDSNSYQVDLSHLSAGLYYLRVSAGQRSYIFKVIRTDIGR